jgi:hypothetical protein
VTAAEKREQNRRAFVEYRRPFQEAVLNADGQLVVHQFAENGMGAIEIPNEGTTYRIPISKNDGLQVWLYNTDASIGRVLQVGTVGTP